MKTIRSVLVVVVNHNTPELTACAVSSSLAAYGERQDRELSVVVANVSCTSAGMYRCDEPRVSVIETSFNIGFGASNNLAVATAGDDWDAVLLLNSDAQLEAGCLDKLVEVLEAQPDVGAVGPRIVWPDRRLQLNSARKVPTVRSDACLYLGRYLGLGWLANRLMFYPANYYLRPQYPEILSGACMLVRRSTWEQVSGFDERYFMYREDVQLCLDASRFGWRSRYEPDAVCLNLLGQSGAGSLSVEQRRSAILFMSADSLRAICIRGVIVVEAGVTAARAALSRATLRDAARLFLAAAGRSKIRPFRLHFVGPAASPETADNPVSMADEARRFAGVSTCLVLLDKESALAGMARLHGHAVWRYASRPGLFGLRQARSIIRVLWVHRPLTVLVDPDMRPSSRMPTAILRRLARRGSS